MLPVLYPYFILLGIINILSVWQWKALAKEDKIIALLIGLTTIEEIIAALASHKFQNNLWVFHIYSPIEFFLISLYFNYCIRTFRKKKIGLGIGLFGIVLAICNTLFIQKITTINSYYLLFEGSLVIIYCLLSFHQILMDEERLPYRFAHFWITICFIIYWSSTFTGWGIYNVLDKDEFLLNPIFDKVLAAANFAFYLGLSAVFIFYKKLIPSGG